MRDELYFCLYLTEGEHFFVEGELEELCQNHNLELLYYRQLKDGHKATDELPDGLTRLDLDMDD